MKNLCIVLFFFIVCSCNWNESKGRKKVIFNEIFVSYYPSGNNYDIDSIKVGSQDTLDLLQIEKIFVEFRDTSKFKSQNLILSHGQIFVNSLYNGANKPFIWDEPFVNSFDVSLDSVRRYLKTFIIKNNVFSIYTAKYGKTKVDFSDTSRIQLKELYGGI